MPASCTLTWPSCTWPRCVSSTAAPSQPSDASASATSVGRALAQTCAATCGGNNGQCTRCTMGLFCGGCFHCSPAALCPGRPAQMWLAYRLEPACVCVAYRSGLRRTPRSGPPYSQGPAPWTPRWAGHPWCSRTAVEQRVSSSEAGPAASDSDDLFCSSECPASSGVQKPLPCRPQV